MSDLVPSGGKYLKVEKDAVRVENLRGIYMDHAGQWRIWLWSGEIFEVPSEMASVAVSEMRRHHANKGRRLLMVGLGKPSAFPTRTFAQEV